MLMSRRFRFPQPSLDSSDMRGSINVSGCRHQNRIQRIEVQERGISYPRERCPSCCSGSSWSV
jgi:hypothetical protein